MSAEGRTWIDYWDNDRIFRSVMASMTRYFFESSGKLLNYTEKDVVLDFGCGPGFLIENLKDRVAEIHGLDTSPRMIAECRRRFRGCGNVFLHTLARDSYTDLSFLKPKRFTIAVVLSVVQYFRSAAEVADLIRQIADISAPGASLLIADIPTGSGPLLDTIELVRSCWKEGIMAECIRFLARTRFSRYSRTRGEQGLLYLPVQALQRLMVDLGLKGEILSDPLTYNRRRVHLLAHF